MVNRSTHIYARNAHYTASIHIFCKILMYNGTLKRLSIYDSSQTKTWQIKMPVYHFTFKTNSYNNTQTCARFFLRRNGNEENSDNARAYFDNYKHTYGSKVMFRMTTSVSVWRTKTRAIWSNDQVNCQSQL